MDKTLKIVAGIILCSTVLSMAEEAWKTDSVFAGGDSLAAGGIMGDFTLSRYYSAESLKVFDPNAAFWDLHLQDNDSAILSGSQGEFSDTTGYLRRDSLIILSTVTGEDSIPFVIRGEQLITKLIQYRYMISGVLYSQLNYVLPNYYDTTTLDSLNSISGFQYIIRKCFVYYLSRSIIKVIFSDNPVKGSDNIQIKIRNGNLFVTTQKPANNSYRIALYNMIGKRLCNFVVGGNEETVCLPIKSSYSGNTVLVRINDGKQTICRKIILFK